MSSRNSPAGTQRKSIKQGVSLDEARRRRGDEALEIRKNKREEGIMKRRAMFSVDESYSSPVITATPDVANIPSIVQNVLNPDQDRQLEAVVQLRKLLSIEKNPPISQILATGVLPNLVNLLTSPVPKISFEAAWAVTNIASGTSEQTAAVIHAGAVPAFIYLLGSSDPEVREQAVWAIGNIAGDSAQCRDFVLQNNVLGPLLQILSVEQKQSMLRNATWALSNLCRGKPQPDFRVLSVAVPVLARLLHSDDNEILTDSLWAFSYLTDAQDAQIEAILGSGFAGRVVELLSHTSTTVQTPALRVVGNIVTGSDTITQTMINLNILKPLWSLLQSPRKALRKEAAWTVSNITAGNTSQTQAVFEAQIIPLITNLLKVGDFDIKKECAWVLSNASTHKNPKQIKYISDQGGIKLMIDLLKNTDSKVISIVFEFLDNVLSTGAKVAKEGVNPYCSIVEECEGVDLLENLQTHNSQEVYEKAQTLLEKYFDAEDVDENENSNNQFQFTAPQPTTFSL